MHSLYFYSTLYLLCGDHFKNISVVRHLPYCPTFSCTVHYFLRCLSTRFQAAFVFTIQAQLGRQIPSCKNFALFTNAIDIYILYYTKYICTQSTTFSVPSSELGAPTPSPASERAGGGLSPNSDGQRKSLALCLLGVVQVCTPLQCAQCPLDQL